MSKSFSDQLFSGGGFSKCADTHPALAIAGYKLYGGSASHPIHKDCDVYVSLQSGSTSGLSSDPWEEKPVVEIHYSILDGAAPKNVTRFKKMIDYLCNQLQAGKKVHVGCIGGHGRTGTVLAAVVAQLGEKDAIRYVRDHYCSKAVESREQVRFLVQNYGVDKAEPSKSFETFRSTSSGSSYTPTYSTGSPSQKAFGFERVLNGKADVQEEIRKVRAARAKSETTLEDQKRTRDVSRRVIPMATARSIFRRKSVGKKS